MEEDMTGPQYSQVLVKRFGFWIPCVRSQSEVSIRGIIRELSMDPALFFVS